MLNTSARRATRTPPRCGSVVGAGGLTDALARASRNFPPRCRPCWRPGGRVGALTGRRAEQPTVCAPAGYYGPLAPLGLGGFPTRRAQMPPPVVQRRHCVGCLMPEVEGSNSLPQIPGFRPAFPHSARRGAGMPGNNRIRYTRDGHRPRSVRNRRLKTLCARRSLISAGVAEAWAG